MNNQLFGYSSDCGNLVLKATMSLEDFNEKYNLLGEIVEKHKKKYKPKQKFQTPLMPFFCFKLPNEILNKIGLFDETFGECFPKETESKDFPAFLAVNLFNFIISLKEKNIQRLIYFFRRI